MKTKLKTGSIDKYEISDEIGQERPLVDYYSSHSVINPNTQ